MNESWKEYLRLGRMFNAEILALILVISYCLTAQLNEKKIDVTILVFLFFAGIFAHIWGCYNNDRMDLSIDKKASYCSHKPLVSGSISIHISKTIEYCALIFFVSSILVSHYLSRGYVFSISVFVTCFYVIGFVVLAGLYNRFNKSNMFINIVGQMYASFAVLIGMSIVVDFNFIVFLSAIIMGLNGVYLNIIEADLKDIEGDIVNVPKALGVHFKQGKVLNILSFYVVNEVIKVTMFVVILVVLLLQDASIIYYIVACVLFVVNLLVRIVMFRHLSPDREKMKKYIAIQEFTAILLISIIYTIIHPLIPVAIILFVGAWLILWNKILYRTYLRPQV